MIENRWISHVLVDTDHRDFGHKGVNFIEPKICDMELRVRPKSDFLKLATWRELYVLTLYWKSDMDFYREELHFLRFLTDRYFKGNIKHEENIDEMKGLGDLLSKTQQWHRKVAQKIDLHLSHLKNFSENALTREEQLFRSEHEELEDHLFRFLRAFQRVKKHTYNITENIARMEMIRHFPVR